MKKSILIILVIMLVFANEFGDVTKKTKTEVKFNGLGVFSTVSIMKLSGSVKADEIDNSLRVENVDGQKLRRYFVVGKITSICNFLQMRSYYLNHLSKTYTTGAMIKVQHPADQNSPKENQAGIKSTNLDVKVIINKFTVTDTGEQREINSFPCRKYQVFWAYKWEDLINGGKGNNKMETNVWTTEQTVKISQIKAEEKAFNREYFDKIGFTTGGFGEQIFGSKWIETLTSIDKNSSSYGMPVAAIEMKRLKGYPIVVEGIFYSSFISDKGKSATRKHDPTVPKLTFHTEVLELSNNSINPVDLKVPTEYKK